MVSFAVGWAGVLRCDDECPCAGLARQWPSIVGVTINGVVAVRFLRSFRSILYEPATCHPLWSIVSIMDGHD